MGKAQTIYSGLFHESVSVQNEIEGLQVDSAHRVTIAGSRGTTPGTHSSQGRLVEARITTAAVNPRQSHISGFAQLDTQNNHTGLTKAAGLSRISGG